MSGGEPDNRLVPTASFAIVLVAEAFAVSGQLTLKTAMDRVGIIGLDDLSSPMPLLELMVGKRLFWAGLLLFGISAVFWMVALSRLPLSLAYPLGGVQHVVIVVLSWLLLEETVPLLRWLGVCVVGAGLVVVGLSFGSDENGEPDKKPPVQPSA